MTVTRRRLVTDPLFIAFLAIAGAAAVAGCNGVYRIVVEDFPTCPPPHDTTTGKADTLWRPLGCPGTLPDTSR